MKTKWIISLYLIIFLPLAADAAFTIKSWSIDNGVTESRGGAFTLRATIGQSESGTLMQNGSYTLSGGFWFPQESRNMCMAPIIMYLLQ